MTAIVTSVAMTKPAICGSEKMRSPTNTIWFDHSPGSTW